LISRANVLGPTPETEVNTGATTKIQNWGLKFKIKYTKFYFLIVKTGEKKSYYWLSDWRKESLRIYESTSAPNEPTFPDGRTNPKKLMTIGSDIVGEAHVGDV